MDSHSFWKNLTMYNENVLKWCGSMYEEEPRTNNPTMRKDVMSGLLQRLVRASVFAVLASGCCQQPIPEPPVICTIANAGECMLIQGKGESMARILETYFDCTMPEWRTYPNAPGRLRLIERAAEREHTSIVLDTKDATGWKAYNEAVRTELARSHNASVAR